MLNIDKMIANEQLFTELTSEEDAAVSGGGFVNFGNIDQGNGNDSINVGSTPPLLGGGFVNYGQIAQGNGDDSINVG